MARNTGPTPATVELCWERDRGACVDCGVRLIFSQRGQLGGWDLQHRKARGMGGTKDPAINSPVNLIPLCKACHALAESRDEGSKERGMFVSRFVDPASVAVLHAAHGLVFLEFDGTVTPAGGKRERQYFPF